jgi:hypothetical protein
METKGFPETPETKYQSTLHYIPESKDLLSYCLFENHIKHINAQKV